MTRLKAAMIATFLLVFGIAWAADNRFVVEIDGQEPDTTDIGPTAAGLLLDGQFVTRTGVYTHGSATYDMRLDADKVFDVLQDDDDVPAARFLAMDTAHTTATLFVYNGATSGANAMGIYTAGYTYGIQATSSNFAGAFSAPTGIISLGSTYAVNAQAVGAGATAVAATGDIIIDGNADEIQLLVQGNSSQTANLMTLETSAGSDVFAVTNAGLATAVNLQATAMTAGRAAYYGTAGLLAGDAGFTYSDTNDAITLTGGADATRLNVTANATQTINQAIFESSAGTDYLAIGPPVLANGGTQSWLRIDGTLPSSPSAAVNGANLQITGAGTAAFAQRGLNVDLVAGYTGAVATNGIRINNASAGTGADVLSTAAANIGVNAFASATTTGHNWAGRFSGVGGNRSGGLIAFATTAKNSATNIGVVGLGLNTGSTPTQVGGFFGLMSTEPTYASAALMADNGSQTSDIFVARDNGTAVMTVADGGAITTTGRRIKTPSASQAITAVGNAILANSAIVEINPDADYTLTSTPTIADGTKGEIVRIIAANGEANTVTVQDQDSLGSSNLQLGAASRAISGKDVLTIMFDGTDWIEVSYANN